MFFFFENQTVIYVAGYVAGLLPYSFNNMFLVTRQVHSYGTRISELFIYLNAGLT